MNGSPELSVVVPCYNERETLGLLRGRLLPVLETACSSFEVIFVDDGSTDGTERLLDELAFADGRLRVLHLSRNFGHQAALSAGMEWAAGDAVVLMDGDLQDPPEVIPELIERWRAGYEVVYAVRRSRRDGLLKRMVYAGFYRSLRTIANIDAPLDAGDFSLLDRHVVQVLVSMPERNRFLRGLRAWAGFRQTAVPYDRAARAGGRTKYTFRKLVRLALSGYVGFSTMPLRLSTFLGGIAAALGMGLGTWSVVLKLLGDPAPRGWASVFSAVLFVGGVQLLMLGILGEYVGRVYDEVRRRPLFVVREHVGFDKARDDHTAPSERRQPALAGAERRL